MSYLEWLKRNSKISFTVDDLKFAKNQKIGIIHFESIIIQSWIYVNMNALFWTHDVRFDMWTSYKWRAIYHLIAVIQSLHDHFKSGLDVFFQKFQ